MPEIEKNLTYPALFVAANDASTRDKIRADYVCDGNDDQVEINLAISDLGGGGRVVLSTGKFNLSETVSISQSNTIVMGQGWKTTLHVNDSSNIFAITYDSSSTAISGCSVKDLNIDCNGNSQSTGGGGIWASGCVQCVFDNLWIYQPYNTGIYFSQIVAGGGSFGHHNRVNNCLFDHGEDSSGSGQALRFDSSDENTVINCDFETMGGSGSNNYVIYDQCGLNSIIGNVFVGGKSSIWINYCSRNKIIGNTFDGVGGHCVLLRSSHSIVTSNTMYNIAGSAPNNTYSGVYIETGDKNIVTNNVMLSSSTDNRTRSFIRDTSNGKNLITSNQLQTEGIVGTSYVEITPINNLIKNNYGLSPVISKTSDYTTRSEDEVILADATLGWFTISLTTAVGNNGKTFLIKKTDYTSNVIVIETDGTETIDGSPTYIINVQYGSLLLVSDGSNWNII